MLPVAAANILGTFRMEPHFFRVTMSPMPSGLLCLLGNNSRDTCNGHFAFAAAHSKSCNDRRS